jgi:uncharacterized protein (TIGR02453 family)
LSIAPYKTNLAVSFGWIERADGSRGDAETHTGVGAYFNFEPGGMYVGGGLFMPEKAALEAFRAAVRDDPDRVRALIEDPRFVAAMGGLSSHHPTLKRVPAGYPADHLLAHLFTYKDVVFGAPLSDADVLSPALPDRLAEAYEAAVPVFRFLGSLGR